jgi:hypothetical protein
MRGWKGLAPALGRLSAPRAAADQAVVMHSARTSDVNTDRGRMAVIVCEEGRGVNARVGGPNGSIGNPYLKVLP